MVVLFSEFVVLFTAVFLMVLAMLQLWDETRHAKRLAVHRQRFAEARQNARWNSNQQMWME